MNIDTLISRAESKLGKIPDALGEFKKSHLNRFKTHGFNEVILDSYKFTNLENFFSGSPSLVEHKNQTLPSLQASIPTITFQNGKMTLPQDLPKGLSIKKIKDSFSELESSFKEDNALSHLHHALFDEGFVIEIEKNKEIEIPLRILTILGPDELEAPTYFIVAHPFSKATIIEETRGLESSQYAAISETYIKAKTGSLIEHIEFDQGSDEGLHHGSLYADIDKDASVKSFIFNLGGKLNRKNLSLTLKSSGANAESYALFLTDSKEHSDINSVIHHEAADTTSSQISKGILDGKSKGIFTGKIHIHPKAQRVNSSQVNKNLLLSSLAQVHSQPQLEIFADDVKCSHGSTTGQLSPEEVFYFQARGIPEEKAKTILAHGFGLEVVQKIQQKSARDHIESQVMEKLSQKFKMGGLV